MNNGKKVILAVSFGTSYQQSREDDIGGIEQAFERAFPDYEVRRAFTSQMIINKLRKQDNLVIENVQEAAEHLVKDKAAQVVVQPTHVIPGEEYNKMMAHMKPFEKHFSRISYGSPLLSDDRDYKELASILEAVAGSFLDDRTAVVFMGHGSEHEANAAYEKLESIIHEDGYKNCFIGTVEAMPDLEDAVKKVKKSGASRVVLKPLMIVAGDHANHDMAGEDDDSWKSRFEAEGFETECVVTGLGRLKEIQRMFVRHAEEAMNR